MNLRDLEYFMAVAEERHFSRAAQRCYVSQPTLSMQIKKLEAELGIQLFEREGKKVILTAIGQIILTKVQNILKESIAIENIAKGLQQPFASPYKVGVIPTLAPDLLPIIQPLLKKTLPQLKLIIWEGQTRGLSEKLLVGELDFLLLALPLKLTDTVEQLLFKENFYLALPSNHPLAKNKKIRQNQLKNQEILLLEEGHCLRDQALEVCQFNQAYETTEFRFSSLSTLIEIIKNGQGMTLLPQLSLRRFADKRLKFIPFKLPSPHRNVGMVWRSSHPFSKNLQQIFLILKSFLKSPSSADIFNR